MSIRTLTLLLATVISLSAQIATAETVYGITDSETPFTGANSLRKVGIEVTTHNLDAPQAFEEELGRDLPGDEESAKAIVAQRIKEAGTAAIEEQISLAYSGLMFSLKYRLNRYPAVVINEEAVIYGVPHLPDALRIYQTWKDQ